MRSVDDETPTFKGALSRLAARGLSINAIIDVGASNGAWSAELMHFLPTANYLLIEANAVHEAALRRFCKGHPNASYVLASAGERSGKIYFDGSDPFGGLAMESQSHQEATPVRCVSIDDAVAGLALDGPFLIKLDTHGFELPIFRGAELALAAAEALVIECYNFRIAPDCILFYEMCGYLDERGFRCIDIFDPMYRPGDRAFWQCDIVFVRKDRPEFARTAYCDNTLGTSPRCAIS
jgi:FkbM family methyltransferase